VKGEEEDRFGGRFCWENVNRVVMRRGKCSAEREEEGGGECDNVGMGKRGE